MTTLCDEFTCPDCCSPLVDVGGVRGCLCLWGGRMPTPAMIEEFMPAHDGSELLEPPTANREP